MTPDDLDPGPRMTTDAGRALCAEVGHATWPEVAQSALITLSLLGSAVVLVLLFERVLRACREVSR